MKKRVNPFDIIDKLVVEHCRVIGCAECPLSTHPMTDVYICSVEDYIRKVKAPCPLSDEDPREEEVIRELNKEIFENWHLCTYCKHLYIDYLNSACCEKCEDYIDPCGGEDCEYWEANEETEEKIEQRLQQLRRKMHIDS